MTASAALSIPIQDAAPCACGAHPTQDELDWLARTYSALARICGVCGRPIRILRVLRLKHHHDLDPEESRETSWDFDGYEEEPHTTWCTSRPDYSLDVAAHEDCMRYAAAPHADWEGSGIHKRPTDARRFRHLAEESPCPRCGDKLTEEARRLALEHFGAGQRPCAVCRRSITLLDARISHRHLFKEHACQAWRIQDWRVEPTVDWVAHWRSPDGVFRSVDLVAHWDCARAAMPHAIWTPPLPRMPWKKQDWSARIEPFYRGIIQGEAVPDWGRILSGEEARRLWGER